MKNFTKHLHVRGFNALFIFSRITISNSPRYHIAVADSSHKLHLFDMREVSEGWKIINAPKVPDWILDSEKDLERMIMEEELKSRS